MKPRNEREGTLEVILVVREVVDETGLPTCASAYAFSDDQPVAGIKTQSLPNRPGHLQAPLQHLKCCSNFALAGPYES